MGSRRMLALAVVLALLPAPVRPSDWRTYDVRDYGAAGDGVQLDTPHIQAAIDAAVAAGGGLVLLPAAHSDSQARSAALTSQPLSAASAEESQPTVYLSSGITVGSNVVLRIERGAVLGSSRRWADFNYTLVLATDCDPGPCLEWRRHPIVLFSSCAKPVNPGKAGMRCDEWTRVTNVTLDGGGEIHGEGDSWWNSEKYMGAAYQRPHILFPFFVTNLRVKDLTLLRSPWWTVHILACRDVVLSNLRIDAEVDYTSSIYPTNNVDGIDISSSQDVLVEHSFIKPGDDCVVIYALHPNEMVTRNITVRNTTCHTPFSIGNGDPGRMEYIEDVLFENCTVKGGLTPNDQRFKPRWWQTALRIKGNPGANATVRNVTFRDIQVVGVDLVFDLAMHYACQNTSGTANYGDCVAAQHPSPAIAPSVSEIRFENVRGTAWRSGWFRCLAEAPCAGVTFEGIDVQASEPFVCEHAEVSGWAPAEQACAAR